MITNVLLGILVLALVAVAAMLFRGFANLNRRLDEALRAFHTPILGALPDVENTIAVVNVGSGTAIDVEWKLSGSGESGFISYLNPQQSWHIQLPEETRGGLTLTYKSTSGDAYNRTFDVAQVTASESRLALA